MKTMRMHAFVFAALLLVFASVSHAEEADHYAVVSEYVRELGAVEDVRVLGEKELSTSKDFNEKMATVIRGSTRAKLELSTNISVLNTMQLKKPFETLIPMISELYQDKIALYDEMAKMAGALASGPQPGVDYGAYVARTPEITAKLEFLDKTLFNSTPLIFALLIDQKPDSQNHLSRLLITKAQRKQLADRITQEFGKKLDHSDKNYTVSSAWVLRYYLTKKGYKCSDEP
ncbi:MAG TPA: hypothetical protein VGV14_05105 [Rhodanobacter sp.]|nr:hypothetical protein [Rhodanobacter sp.]